MLKTKKRKFCNKRIDLINFEYLNNIIMSIIKNTTILKKKSVINCCSNNIIDIKKILTIFPHKLCNHKKCKNTRSYLGKSDVLPNIGILKFDVLKNLRKLKKSKHLIKFF